MLLHRYGPNKDGRDFVVGDIHGYYSVLMDHLDAVNFDPERDRLFCTGDLVDRGKENHKVLMLTQEPWFISVRGNHEDMAFNGLLAPQDHFGYERRHGKWARNESYKEGNMTHRECINLLHKLHREMPLAIELEHANGKRYGFVHADVPEFDWAKVLSDPDHAQWDRRALLSGWTHTVKGIDYVFHGHTHIGTEGPRRIANRVYLDSSVYVTGVFNLWEIGNEEAIETELFEWCTVDERDFDS